MDLPKVTDLNVGGKRVLVRADLDVPLRMMAASSLSGRTEDSWEVADDRRLRLVAPTVQYLIDNGARVVVGGHLGRPHLDGMGFGSRGKPGLAEVRVGGAGAVGGVGRGSEAEEGVRLSLRPVGRRLADLVERLVVYNFTEQLGRKDVAMAVDCLPPGGLLVLENLRFEVGETAEAGSRKWVDLAEALAGAADLFVNEAFAESHREAASITGAVKIIEKREGGGGAFGMRFCDEVRVLSEVLERPRRPLVAVLGGAKIETKLPAISAMERWADAVLVGGRLPSEIAARGLKFSKKVRVGSLGAGGKDVDRETVGMFKDVLMKAGMVIWNGPMGMFEVEGGEEGTREVAKAIAGSHARKIAGGGDTEAALVKFGLTKKFDWISIGGGAMLEFLAKGTLPGIEAIE